MTEPFELPEFMGIVPRGSVVFLRTKVEMSSAAWELFQERLAFLKADLDIQVVLFGPNIETRAWVAEP